MPASHASALFDIVGEGAPVGLAFVDADLRFVRVNAALAAINGRPVEEHLGRRIDEVLPEFGTNLLDVYREVLATGEPVLARELTGEKPGSGRVRHVLASWFPVHVEGEITGVGVVVVDITDRKTAELRLQTVLQQLPVGVVIAEADGTILLGNDQLETIGLAPYLGSGMDMTEANFVGRRADGSEYALEELPLRRSLMTGVVARGGRGRLHARGRLAAHRRGQRRADPRRR